MRKYWFVLLTLTIIIMQGCSGKNMILKSPDEKLILSLDAGGPLNSLAEFSMKSGDKTIILPSQLIIESDTTGKTRKVRIIKTEEGSFSGEWINDFGEKRVIPDNYNQLKLMLQYDDRKINIIFRAYNEGVAVCWELPDQDNHDPVTIYNENYIFRFSADHMAWSAPYAQALYSYVPLSRITAGCERPLVIECDSNLVTGIGEAGLVDYPRMKFDPDSTGGVAIKSRLDGPARISAPFRSPWRVIIAGNSHGDLLEKNYLFLNLNDHSEISDHSWIKPGKALREVTLTTEGGLAAVDFVSSHGMQYVEFDAGWYGPEYEDSSDARGVNLDPKRSKGPLDLRRVIEYARSKNTGVLLYVNRRALEKQLDELLPIYRDWGVSGIKFGFVQVGSQEVTSWLHEAIRKASEYKMVVDVHDEYRPTGYSRTYPNFLTQEGIRGDEESPSNSHTLVTMFTRMLAGAGDNTICYYNERVENKMGSHASQLAKAVCIFSPLQFLYWYDKPVPQSKKELMNKPGYIGEEPELEFFRDVTTVWDETIVLHGKPGEYGMIARKKDDQWFIGGINGGDDRTLDVKFRFLDPGKKYIAKVYTDDQSVPTRTHVRIDTMNLDHSSVYNARLLKNNGLAMHIIPVE